MPLIFKSDGGSIIFGNEVHYTNYIEERKEVKRRKRIVFSQRQIEALLKEFETNMYPSRVRQDELAASLCLDQKKIKIWFQNTRNKVNRHMKKFVDNSEYRKIKEIALNLMCCLEEDFDIDAETEFESYWATINPPAVNLNTNCQTLAFNSEQLAGKDDLDLIDSIIRRSEDF